MSLRVREFRTILVGVGGGQAICEKPKSPKILYIYLKPAKLSDAESHPIIIIPRDAFCLSIQSVAIRKKISTLFFRPRTKKQT